LVSCQQPPASDGASVPEAKSSSFTDQWRIASSAESDIRRCILRIPLRNPVDISEYQRLRATVLHEAQKAGIPLFRMYAHDDDLFLFLTGDCGSKERHRMELERSLASAPGAAVAVHHVDAEDAEDIVRIIAESTQAP
jgi:hypothetical protein